MLENLRTVLYLLDKIDDLVIGLDVETYHKLVNQKEKMQKVIRAELAWREEALQREASELQRLS